MEGKTTEKIDIWLDCDPGHDDMMAIILAGHSPKINLLGLSTVGGNANIEQVTVNALKTLWFAGIKNIDVLQGSIGPLFRPEPDHQEVFGDSGLDGANLPFPEQKVLQENLFSHLSAVILKNPKKVTLVATGPCTNFAILFKAYPEVKKNVEKIVIMGGAIGYGNVHPAAEFNIGSDPEAAQMLLNTGLPFVMIPIEVTHKVLYNNKIREKFIGRGTPFVTALAKLLDFFEVKCREMDETDGAPTHDPCTIAYLIDPTIFTMKEGHVKIECRADDCDGRSVVWFDGWRKIDKKKNALVGTDVNSPKFWEIMVEAFLKADDVSPLNKLPVPTVVQVLETKPPQVQPPAQ